MPRGKPFPKGRSGNPKGRPPLPQDLKQARELNKEELERVLNRFLYMTRPELKAINEDRSTPLIDLMVANLMLMGIKHGDDRRLGFILDRLIGKVKDQIEHSGAIATPGLTHDSLKRIFSDPKLTAEARALALKLAAPPQPGQNGQNGQDDTGGQS